eukprot:g27231.t1
MRASHRIKENLPRLKALHDYTEAAWTRTYALRRYSVSKEDLQQEFVSSRLQQDQRSLAIRAGEVVLKVHVSVVAANTQCEDRHTLHCVGPSRAPLFSVIDGHAGFAMAQAVSELLPGYVHANLTNQLSPRGRAKKWFQNPKASWYEDPPDSPWDPPPTLQSLREAITTLDNDLGRMAQDPAELRSLSEEELRGRLMPALSGACVLVACLENDSLKIANAGDCRAVMGSWNDGQEGERATRLSNDHNTNNKDEITRILDEITRILREHPETEHKKLIEDGRLLGRFIPTRAMGDYCLKWALDNPFRMMLRRSFPAFRLPACALTPPYLTSNAEIAEFPLSSDDRVLILATDGLWDTLKDEDAVKASRRFLSEGGQAGDNLATHLVRTALGRDPALISQLLTLPPDKARHFYDDITCLVVTRHSASSELGETEFCSLPEAVFQSAIDRAKCK